MSLRETHTLKVKTQKLKYYNWETTTKTCNKRDAYLTCTVERQPNRDTT